MSLGMYIAYAYEEVADKIYILFFERAERVEKLY